MLLLCNISLILGQLTLCDNFPSTPHRANTNCSHYHKPLFVYSNTSLWVYCKKTCWKPIISQCCVGIVLIIISITINTCIFTGNFKLCTRVIVFWWLYNGNQVELNDIQQWILHGSLFTLLLKSHRRTLLIYYHSGSCVDSSRDFSRSEQGYFSAMYIVGLNNKLTLNSSRTQQ